MRSRDRFDAKARDWDVAGGEAVDLSIRDWALFRRVETGDRFGTRAKDFEKSGISRSVSDMYERT